MSISFTFTFVRGMALLLAVLGRPAELHFLNPFFLELLVGKAVGSLRIILSNLSVGELGVFGLRFVGFSSIDSAGANQLLLGLSLFLYNDPKPLLSLPPLPVGGGMITPFVLISRVFLFLGVDRCSRFMM